MSGTQPLDPWSHDAGNECGIRRPQGGRKCDKEHDWRVIGEPNDLSRLAGDAQWVNDARKCLLRHTLLPLDGVGRSAWVGEG